MQPFRSDPIRNLLEKIYDKHNDTFEAHFNNVLRSGTTLQCTNLSFQSTLAHQSNRDLLITLPTAPNYTDKLRFAHRTYYVCRATQFGHCRNPGCIAYSHQLRSVMPPCATWPGFQHWVLQAAACLCSLKGFPQIQGMGNSLATTIERAVDLVKAIAAWDPGPQPVKSSYDRTPAAFTNWAEQLDVHEVLCSISWLNGIVSGRYQHISLFQSPDVLASTDNHDDKTINQAIARIHEQGLCLHRIWTIALNLPGRESNIPALVHHQHQHCSHKHDFCSTGVAHRNCTFDYCEISAVNFTSVVQLHHPSCNKRCKKKQFPIHFLDEVAKKGKPTAWAIDGELRPLESGEPYIAISHVWSDGTGGSGSVNICLYDFFCHIARCLNCKGLWWDAICMPENKQARAMAINRMHEYYSQAACTVVHDRCLVMSEWVDYDRASFALVMSNWFSRGWTALELATSKQVMILFGYRKSPGSVLKNIDGLLCRPGTVSSLSHLMASTAIRSLRRITEESKLEYSVNDLLISLGPRFTSWAKDRATITGLFVGIGTENLDNQHSIYQQVICKIGRVSADQLFHNASSPVSGPFTWFPCNFFDLPVSSNEPNMKVLGDGSILGEWSIIARVQRLDPQLFFWDMMHPITKRRVREALGDNRHIILAEIYAQHITRGLVVKVMRYENEIRIRWNHPIRCRYVGPIYFRASQPQLRYPQNYTFRIGDGGVDLTILLSWGWANGTLDSLGTRYFIMHEKYVPEAIKTLLVPMSVTIYAPY